MHIVNPDALDGPARRPLVDFVLNVAENFESEYMRPDDPFVHGRVFTVIEAGAELVLRLNRDRSGNESITVIDVTYYADLTDQD